MDINDLAIALKSCAYPEQMSYIDRGILGSGFYPGARGFEGTTPPHGGIMLLGRDWGMKRDYDRLKGSPAKNESGMTWRHTRDIYLLGLHDIPVWCTNYLMGVRHDGKATGNIRSQIAAPAWKDYEASCWEFLNQQVLLQETKLIVVFGEFNRDDLSQRNRLGPSNSQFSTHTFIHKNKQHSATITFADHPHSLIPHIAKERAYQQILRIRAAYSASKQPS